jgi:hypothetical protein
MLDTGYWKLKTDGVRNSWIIFFPLRLSKPGWTRLGRACIMAPEIAATHAGCESTPVTEPYFNDSQTRDEAEVRWGAL